MDCQLLSVPPGGMLWKETTGVLPFLDFAEIMWGAGIEMEAMWFRKRGSPLG